MQPDNKYGRKEILADPPALFSRIRPEAAEQEIIALTQLSRQYCAARQKAKDVRNLTRELSRQIGEAKRSGYPIDALLAEMQEMSAQHRLLAAQAGDMENEIMGYFSSGETGGSPAPQDRRTPAPEERNYNPSFSDIHEISIALLNGEDSEWNAYVERNPAASIYHRIEWRELIHKTFGHTGYYFIARNRERNTVGILPLIHLKSRLFGHFLVSVPYFNYGGAVADHPAIETLLMESANKLAAGLGADHVEYRDDIPREGLPARTEKVVMVLPLPVDPDSLMASFGSKLRSQIRRAQRETPATRFGGEELLDDFYSVFSRNMRDLGTPVYSKKFFRNILHCFPGDSQLVVARLSHKPVAAAFLLGHRDTLEIPWASTLRDVNHLSINTFLYWEILKSAIESEYRYFDFGRSSRDSGTYRFKQQWGAVPRQLYWHYWLSSGGKPPAINPGNPKYALMIKAWQHLPLALSKLLGPPIVRNIP